MPQQPPSKVAYQYAYTDDQGQKWDAELVVDMDWVATQLLPVARHNKSKKAVRLNAGVVLQLKA